MQLSLNGQNISWITKVSIFVFHKILKQPDYLLKLNQQKKKITVMLKKSNWVEFQC